MARAAIFVEGQTELLFVIALISEMAGPSAVGLVIERRHGGGYVGLSVDRPQGVRHELLIVDSCGDGAVLSAIRERHANLSSLGYSLILGLRDLYPVPLADYAQTLHDARSKLPQGGCPSRLIIAKTEIEAWFLQENLHYSVIDSSLTRATIRAATGFDIEVSVAEDVEEPAKLLKKIYRVAHKGYGKSKAQVNRTVQALDFTNLYVEKRIVLSAFDEFASHLEQFLQS